MNKNKFKKGKSCGICGFKGLFCQMDIHHKDNDRNNNLLKNIQILCANCHRLIHYKLHHKGISCKMCNVKLEGFGKFKLCFDCRYKNDNSLDKYFYSGRYAADLGYKDVFDFVKKESPEIGEKCYRFWLNKFIDRFKKVSVK